MASIEIAGKSPSYIAKAQMETQFCIRSKIQNLGCLISLSLSLPHPIANTADQDTTTTRDFYKGT